VKLSQSVLKPTCFEKTRRKLLLKLQFNKLNNKHALKTLRNLVEITTTGMEYEVFSALSNFEEILSDKSNIKQTLMTYI